MQSLTLVVSREDCFNRVSEAIEQFSDVMFFDESDLFGLGDFINQNQEKSKCSGKKTSLFFYPSSSDIFLLNGVSSEALEDFDEVGTRSVLASGIFNLHVLANLPPSVAVLGNSPLNTIFASNRLVFRNAMTEAGVDTKISLFRNGAEIKNPGDYEGRLFRFLPDTHITNGENITSPILIDSNNKSDLNSVPYPFFIEHYFNLKRDVRAYCFGDEHHIFVWDRSEIPSIVDIRTNVESLNVKQIQPTNKFVSNFIERTKEKLQISFFSIDFVSNGDVYIPVDLNPLPTWNWLSARAKELCDGSFKNFCERHFS